jgi:hypothetical protein
MRSIACLALFLLLSCFARATDAPVAPPVFSLMPADVGKVVVLMYKGPPPSTLCEVTFSKEKQAELAQLASQNAGKPVQIVVNGKPVTQITFEPGKTGHSVKFPCTTPEEAFATAKTLLAPAP